MNDDRGCLCATRVALQGQADSTNLRFAIPIWPGTEYLFPTPFIEATLEVTCTNCGQRFWVVRFDYLTEAFAWMQEAEVALMEEGIGPVLPKKFGGDLRGHDE